MARRGAGLPAGQGVLASFVRRRMAERNLSWDELCEAFHTESNRIRLERGYSLKIASARRVLRDAMAGKRGMFSWNQRALAAALDCEINEIKISHESEDAV